jgi:hypothetical protein
MTTQNNDGKFLRIVSNGFVPFSLSSNHSVSHKDCHPLLENKSHEDFYNLVANGDIGFHFGDSPKQEVGKMYIRPLLKFGNAQMSFHYSNNFVVPPVADAHVENEMLKIKLDLRIDLKDLIAPSKMNTFLNTLTAGGITDVGWEYVCTLTEGGRKITRSIGSQSIDLYTLERFKTKKLILAAV